MEETMNGTQVPKEDQERIDKLHELIGQSIKGYIGQPINEGMKKRLHDIIIDLLPNVDKRTEVSAKTLWSTFTLWQKMTWWFTRKIYRGEIKLYEQTKRYLYGKRMEIDQGDDGEGNYDMATSEMVLITEIIDEFENRFKKWFYESDPKSMLLCTLNIFPVKPLECIEANFTIGLK